MRAKITGMLSHNVMSHNVKTQREGMPLRSRGTEGMS
jgi:hypothetical protein